MTFGRQNIERLIPYTPGEQPRQGASPRVIKLNTNENPYPPSAQVLEAIRNVPAESLRRYPPPKADGFREVAATVHGVSPDQIIATNGGDELLRMVVTAFCDPRGNGTGQAGGLGEAEPSYSLYDVLADIHDTACIRVPLNDDWSLPADFAARLNAAGCRLAMLVNPHAPSGRLETIARLEAIAREFHGVLLVDEAYVDFARHDALALVRDLRLPNVLLLRTLSKGYSLAGLRFAYGIGSAQIIETLHKVRDSYNTDALAQAAATAALAHRDEARKTWKQVIDERTRLTGQLRQRGFVLPDSESNFVLARSPSTGPSAKTIYESLKQAGILVRYFGGTRTLETEP